MYEPILLLLIAIGVSALEVHMMVYMFKALKKDEFLAPIVGYAGGCCFVTLVGLWLVVLYEYNIWNGWPLAVIH